MAIFQIPTLSSFGLGKYYHLRVVDFHWPKVIWREASLSYLTDFCLSNVNLLYNKVLIVGQLLVDCKLLSVGTHLVETEHFAPMKNVNGSDISARSDNLRKLDSNVQLWQNHREHIFTL